MADSLFRQTFGLGIFISAAGKSILNLLNLLSLVAKHCEMWKYSPVKFANFVYFVLRAEKCNQILKCDYTIPRN